MDYGFIPDILEADHYVFGSQELSDNVLNFTGQWDKYLPAIELQEKNMVETYNCVSFGTLNAVEILHKFLFGKEVNKSERYLGILSGTTESGNSPHKVAETLRKTGTIPENELPFSKDIDTWDKYYSPKPMTSKYIEIGEKWLSKYDFGHEWVFANDYSGNRQELLKQALKRSPLGISVYAWKKKGDIYVKDDQLDNHWCCLYGYVDGEYFKVFDHYDNTFKKLDWDYRFGFCKRYSLGLNLEKQMNFFLRMWRSIINFLIR